MVAQIKTAVDRVIEDLTAVGNADEIVVDRVGVYFHIHLYGKKGFSLVAPSDECADEFSRIINNQLHERRRALYQEREYRFKAESIAVS